MKKYFNVLAIVCCFIFSACSINKMAINTISNALTREDSSNVFMTDPDPQLVGDALPFAMKMYETLLAANPEHQGLLRTTGSLFIMYANAFVQTPAEQMPRWMFNERQAEYERAKNLYLRGMDLIYRGLELEYPRFEGSFQSDELPKILAKMKKSDVPSLYWAAVAGLSAYSLNLMDTTLAFRVPEFYALVNRAYELDADFNMGALDDFLLIYYASLPDYMGGDMAKAEIHFHRALEKSNGSLASPYVSYAQRVSIPAGNYDTFKMYLETALAIDTNANPDSRLINTISQQKARFLLENASQFFFFLGTDDFDYDEDNFDW